MRAPGSFGMQAGERVMGEREGVALPFRAISVILSTLGTSMCSAAGAVRRALRPVVVLAMATTRTPGLLTSSMLWMAEPAGTR